VQNLRQGAGPIGAITERTGQASAPSIR
jgi:hypothetical protein